MARAAISSASAQEPAVTNAVGADQRDKRDAALGQPLGVLDGCGWRVDLIGGGSVLEDVQQCCDVLFDACVEQLLDEFVAP
jgi:hypothetical protein